MAYAFKHRSIFTFNKAPTGGYYFLPIVCTITALPMLLTSNEVAIRVVHTNLEEASKSLGAGEMCAFLNNILQNTASGIAAVVILILIRMIGEYTMSAPVWCA